MIKCMMPLVFLIVSLFLGYTCAFLGKNPSGMGLSRSLLFMKRSSPAEISADSFSSSEALKSRASSAAGNLATGAVALATITAIPRISEAKETGKWKKVELPFKETFFDITFDHKKPDHGWIVGAKGTFLETFDGGNTWSSRAFTALDEDEDINYRFEVTSLSEDEGWIVGKPSILLHTRDGGKQFERIPLSPKLPGEPVSIVSTGISNAEMVTSQGTPSPPVCPSLCPSHSPLRRAFFFSLSEPYCNFHPH